MPTSIRSRARWGAVAASIALVGLAGPAQASSVLPRTADLVSADGTASGCTLRESGSTYLNPKGIRILKQKHEITCTTTWHRLRVTDYAWVLADDGTRTPIYSGGGSLSTGDVTGGGGSATGPICQDDAWGLPYHPVHGTPFTVVLRAVATVKATYDNTGAPFTAKAEKTVTVTC